MVLGFSPKRKWEKTQCSPVYFKSFEECSNLQADNTMLFGSDKSDTAALSIVNYLNLHISVHLLDAMSQSH